MEKRIVKRYSAILKKGKSDKTIIQISKYRGTLNRNLEMCDCSKLHLYEVEFKLDGMAVVPTHKNCGFALRRKTSRKIHKRASKILGN